MTLLSKGQHQFQKPYYFTILVSSTHVASGLLTVENGKLTILGKTKALAYSGTEDCLRKTDQTLSDLGPQAEKVHDTIFAFDQEFIDAKGVKSNKKKQVSTLMDDLSLNPVGFVVIHDALPKSFSSLDKFSSKLIIYIESDKVYVTLIVKGRIISKISVGFSGDFNSEFCEALARLEKTYGDNFDHFPHKVYLSSLYCSQSKLKQFQQQALRRDWLKQFPFLQLPELIIVETDDLVEAVAFHGGRILYKQEGLVDENQPYQPSKSDKQSKDDDQEKFTQINSDDLITSKTDISSTTETMEAPPPRKKQILKSKILSKEKNKRMFKINAVKAIIIGAILGVMTLIGGGYFYLKSNYWVQVDLLLKKQPVNKEVEIRLDPNIEESKPEELLLKANLVEKKLSDQKTIKTTGIKLVGEKATGTIEIFNKTNAEKTFEEGTAFYKGDVKFVLQEDVTVSEKKEVESEVNLGEATVKYGKAEVTLQAIEIGAENNIEKDSEFRIDKYDDQSFSAVAIEDFSGGSSREVRVVAEEDHEKLLQDIKSKLSKEAKTQFEQDSNNGGYIIPTGEMKVIEQQYSSEIGDQDEEVSLEATVSFYGVSYEKGDLEPLAQEVLYEEVPTGYQLMSKTPDIMSVPQQEEEENDPEAENTQNNDIKILVNISSVAVPEIDVDQIKNELLGKNSITVLKSLGGEILKEADVSYHPGVASYLFKELPKSKDKIVIKVKEE